MPPATIAMSNARLLSAQILISTSSALTVVALAIRAVAHHSQSASHQLLSARTISALRIAMLPRPPPRSSEDYSLRMIELSLCAQPVRLRRTSISAHLSQCARLIPFSAQMAHALEISQSVPPLSVSQVSSSAGIIDVRLISQSAQLDQLAHLIEVFNAQMVDVLLRLPSVRVLSLLAHRRFHSSVPPVSADPHRMSAHPSLSAQPTSQSSAMMAHARRPHTNALILLPSSLAHQTSSSAQMVHAHSLSSSAHRL